MSLFIEVIRAISILRYDDVNICQKNLYHMKWSIFLSIPLISDHIASEEQALEYFNRRKLKTLSKFQEWKDGETKKIDQFYMQNMFRDPIDPLCLYESAVILQPNLQYSVKQNGTCHFCMCCNGSNNSAPQLHDVYSTCSSCVELPVQKILLGITADLGLNVFGGDATDAYANSHAPDENFLSIDKVYAD